MIWRFTTLPFPVVFLAVASRGRRLQTLSGTWQEAPNSTLATSQMAPLTVETPSNRLARAKAAASLLFAFNTATALSLFSAGSSQMSQALSDNIRCAASLMKGGFVGRGSFSWGEQSPCHERDRPERDLGRGSFTFDEQYPSREGDLGRERYFARKQERRERRRDARDGVQDFGRGRHRDFGREGGRGFRYTIDRNPFRKDRRSEEEIDNGLEATSFLTKPTDIYTDLSSDPSVGKEVEALRTLPLGKAKSVAQDLLAEAVTHQPAQRAVRRWQPPANVPRTDPLNTWGTLPLGFKLCSRLKELGFLKPMPIQTRAFDPISKGRNVVIGSETGSGKTLAFLLPLLMKMHPKKASQMLILVPSLVLARQIKAVLDDLLPPNPQGSAVFKFTGSTVHIINDAGFQNKQIASLWRDSQLSFAQEELLKTGNTPILIGIPDVVKRVMNEVDDVMAVFEESGRIILGYHQAKQLALNLKTVVLDEADGLLNSIGLEQAKKRQEEFIRNASLEPAPTTFKERRRYAKELKRQGFTPSPTEMTLEDLPKALSDLQIVCASATVGQTLRGQLQKLLEVESKDAASILVSGEEQNWKQKNQERHDLLPSTLTHKYLLLDRDPQEKRSDFFIKALHEALDLVKPGPAVVFAPADVKKIATSLKKKGFKDVRQIIDRRIEEEDELGIPGALEVESSAGMLHSEITPEQEASHEATGSASWENTTIWVAGEKYGRGLDLQVDYSFLLGTPSDSARYAHYAGRTARNGRKGTAITLIEHYQAPMIVSFTEQLGISFTQLHPDMDEDWEDELDAIVSGDFFKREVKD